jgi:hypothetical protein
MKAQRVANAMLSFGLWITGAQASEAEPSRPQTDWIYLNLDFTAQPVVGVAGGQDSPQVVGYNKLPQGSPSGRASTKAGATGQA